MIQKGLYLSYNHLLMLLKIEQETLLTHAACFFRKSGIAYDDTIECANEFLGTPLYFIQSLQSTS